MSQTEEATFVGSILRSMVIASIFIICMLNITLVTGYLVDQIDDAAGFADAICGSAVVHPVGSMRAIRHVARWERVILSFMPGHQAMQSYEVVFLGRAQDDKGIMPAHRERQFGTHLTSGGFGDKNEPVVLDLGACRQTVYYSQENRDRTVHGREVEDSSFSSVSPLSQRH